METISKNGWHLTEDALYNYFGDDLPANGDAIHKLLLDCDLREIISCNVVEDNGPVVTQQNADKDIRGPLIVQVQKIRNVVVPKAHENDNSGASRLLRLTLNDGRSTYNALEMAIIKGLEPNSPPGTKLQLTDTIRNERGFLLLTPSNCRVLGGKVEKLIEKWRLKNPHSLTRPRAGDDGQSGPPPWVPFGQKPRLSDSIVSNLAKNVRVMDLAASGGQEAPPISEEFSQARQNTIAQAMQQQPKKSKPAQSEHK